MNSLRRLCSAVLMAVFVPALLSADETPDASKNSPSAHHQVKVRYGAVDAVTGALHLSLPLGPKLPGRIPVGFVWSFDSSETLATGTFRPIEWRPPTLGGLEQMVKVFGQTYSFRTQAKPTDPSLLSNSATLQKWLTDRGVDLGWAQAQADWAATSAASGGAVLDPLESTWSGHAVPSADGTKFLITGAYYAWYHDDTKTGQPVNIHMAFQSRTVVVDGPLAIWNKNLNGTIAPVTYLSNLYGDLVSVTEGTGDPGAPLTFTLRNEKVPTESVTLSVAFTGANTLPAASYRKSMAATLTATHTLTGAEGALPTMQLVGTYRQDPVNLGGGTGDCTTGEATPMVLPNPDFTYPPPPPPSLYRGTFRPDQILVKAGSDTLTTSFTWTSNTAISISHPNGLVEAITFADAVPRLSSLSYDFCTGYWNGFKARVALKYPRNVNPWDDHTSTVWDIIRYKDWSTTLGVTWVKFTGPGVDEAVQIVRQLPALPTFAQDDSTLPTPLQKDFVTTILYYPTSTPTGAFIMGDTSLAATAQDVRGVKLTHPSLNSYGADPLGNKGLQAFLLSSGVILRAEAFVGKGKAPDTGWNPSIPEAARIETTLYDGWDLHSWGNPTGGLTNGLPVNPVARRTTVYPKGLPTHTTVAGDPALSGASDAYGPTRTDEYTSDPAVPPATDGTTVPLWSDGMGTNSGKLRRTGLITRTFDTSLAQLRVLTDQKTLDGPDLPNYRYSLAADGISLTGVTSVDFGTTDTSNVDSLGRLNKTVGTRGIYASTAQNVSFDGSLPNVMDTTTSLTANGATVPANPAQSVTVGKTYGYDGTKRWVHTETDKVSGFTTTYDRDAVGKVTTTTDGLGVKVQTSYDAWGRVASTSRLARGTKGQAGYVGALSTAYAYDLNGKWKEETVTAEAAGPNGTDLVLRTHTDLDAHGRPTQVVQYKVVSGTPMEAGRQTFAYDGFGQKVSESPMLQPKQTAYGLATWSYDAMGRVMVTKDPKGRTLSTVTYQGQVKPATTVDGVALPSAIWVTATDDRGFSRSTLTDALGQKIAVIDQQGHVSRYLYDKDGHLLRTLQGTQKRTYTYNDMGWLLSREEPEEGKTLYSGHTMLGTPLNTQQTGRSGVGAWATGTTLNGYLLPSTLTASGPEGSVSRTLTYDPTSHLLTKLAEQQNLPVIGNQVLTEAYGYDALFRLNTKTVYDGSDTVTPPVRSFAISRVLDAAGQVTSLTYPAGGGRAADKVTYTYDAQHRMAQALFNTANRARMSYDLVSGTSVSTLLTFANGASTKQKVDMGELIATDQAAPYKMDRSAAYLEHNDLSWTAGGLLLARGDASKGTQDAFGYDELQRLTYAKTFGLSGESTEQWMVYDRFGNRLQSDVLFNAGVNNVTKPNELVAWRGTYDAANGITPLSSFTALVQGSAKLVLDGGTNAGSLPTGATYDDLGRITAINAVPGQSTEAVSWVYDPSGRVMRETAKGITSTFLLDGEGLRFKRVKSDGSLTYTVYGFGREPLSVFEQPASGGTLSPQSLLKAPASPKGTLAKAQSQGGDGSARSPRIKRSPKVVQALGGGGGGGGVDPQDPPLPGVTILSPSAGAGLPVGQAITFSGTSSQGPANTSFLWNFGDGTTANGATATHTYATAGTYSVKLIGSAMNYSDGTQTITLYVGAPAVTASASPTSIAAGASSTLTWSATNATLVSIDQGIGTMALSGTKSVTPVITTTYTVTATNPYTSTTAQVTVAVNAPAPPAITSFTSSALNLPAGQSATLSWATQGATTTILNGTSVAATGTLLVTPAATTTYTLVATNPDGPATKALTIVVQGSNQPLIWRKSMVYGFGQLVSEEQSDNGTVYVQSDYVGSPNLMTDATGRVVGRAKNLPFGERFGQTGVKSLRRFTNHEDQDGSAIYMQARTYLPAYGKFAQVDPAYDQTKDDPETWNLYNYVTNNPVTHTDPDGRVAAPTPADAAMLGSTGMVMDSSGQIHTIEDIYPSDPSVNPPKAESTGKTDPQGTEAKNTDTDPQVKSQTGSGTVTSGGEAQEKKPDPKTNSSQSGLAVKTDAKGNVIFDKIGTGYAPYIKEKLLPNGDKLSVGWAVEVGNVYALDGTKIQAGRGGPMEVTITKPDGTAVKGGSELLTPIFGPGCTNKTDCHGTSFAGGQVWINSPEVGKLLTGSGFHKTDSPGSGSVGVYSVSGDIVHSVTWVDRSNVYSKGGITSGGVVPAGPGPGTGWTDASATLTWYSR